MILFAKQETPDLFGINKVMARVDNLNNTKYMLSKYTHNAFLHTSGGLTIRIHVLHNIFAVDNDINSIKKLISLKKMHLIIKQLLRILSESL